MIEGFVHFGNDHAHYAWWQAVLIGLFFLAFNSGAFYLIWYCHREAILECGYRSQKAVRKRFKTQSRMDQILLTRLVREAPKSHPNLVLRMILNRSNLLFAGVSAAGFFGTILTGGAGWAILLLICPGFTSLFCSFGISFIPDLLRVPSERKRYGLGKKKKCLSA